MRLGKGGHVHFCTTVEYDSEKFRAQHVHSRILTFLSDFLKRTENISVEAFEEAKQGLIEAKLSPHLNLAEKMSCFWTNLTYGADSDGVLDMVPHLRLAEELKNIQITDVCSLLRDMIDRPRRSAVWVLGANEKNATFPEGEKLLGHLSQ